MLMVPRPNGPAKDPFSFAVVAILAIGGVLAGCAVEAAESRPNVLFVIVDDLRLAIEVKSSRQVSRDHLRGLRQLAVDQPEIGRRILVCLEPKERRTEDQIEIMPAEVFARRLWAGELL